MFAFFRRLALFRRRPRTPYETALAQIAHGQFAEAERRLAQLAHAATAPRERATLENKRGVALVAMHRRDDALHAFQSALDADARFAPALANIGNLLFEDDHIDDAIAMYEAAIATDDRYALAHINLSAALKRAGRFDESVRALRTARRLEGGFLGLSKRA